jgi:hypothetical protein
VLFHLAAFEIFLTRHDKPLFKVENSENNFENDPWADQCAPSAVIVLVLLAGAALCQLDINVPAGQDTSSSSYRVGVDGTGQSDQRTDSYRIDTYQQQRVDDYRADYYQQQQRSDQRVLTFSATQRISHANVLLPQTVVKNKVRYTVHTANGCFKW